MNIKNNHGTIKVILMFLGLILFLGLVIFLTPVNQIV